MAPAPLQRAGGLTAAGAGAGRARGGKEKAKE